MSRRLISACAVGGNAVSAFLSWRLSATNACDVTLVWKAGFDAVAQYGISFKYVVNNHLRLCRTLSDVMALDHSNWDKRGSSRDKVRQILKFREDDNH